MFITANSLYRDTRNFLRHQFITILLISLFSALITVVLVHSFMPLDEQLRILEDGKNNSFSFFEYIQKMTLHQKYVLLWISVVGTISSLIGNTLLLGGILYLIIAISSGRKVNIFQVFELSFPIFPKLLLQTFLITLVVQLGFMLLLLPGIIMAILFSFAPGILVTEKTNVIDSMRSSIFMVWKNIGLISPAILVWLLAKIMVIFLFSLFSRISFDLISIFLITMSNFISAILIIYLYRLYMLLR